MWFWTEIRFRILRLPLDFWCWNESGEVSDFDFESQLVLHVKWCKLKLTIYNLSRKMWFLANEFKHKHIIYHWKSFFATNIDSRSLSKNKALFGLCLLSKFCHFARKSVPIIRTLLSWTEGTITTRMLRRNCGGLEPTLGVAGDGGATAASHGVATCVACAATVAYQPSRS